jgi:transcriptional regulator with XRE-family HTH domain
MGDLIRAQRDRAKLSQEGLAHKANVNRSYYASLEAGRRNASIDTLGRLAAALGCDTADLVRGTQAVPGRKDPLP